MTADRIYPTGSVVALRTQDQWVAVEILNVVHTDINDFDACRYRGRAVTQATFPTPPPSLSEITFTGASVAEFLSPPPYNPEPNKSPLWIDITFPGDSEPSMRIRRGSWLHQMLLTAL